MTSKETMPSYTECGEKREYQSSGMSDLQNRGQNILENYKVIALLESPSKNYTQQCKKN